MDMRLIPIYFLSHIDDLYRNMEADNSHLGLISAEEKIGSFNKILLSVLGYAGAIVLAVAVIKLIIAIAQQDAQSKTTAAMMLGLGILLISSDAVIASIVIDHGGDGKAMTLSIIDIIGSIGKIVALILAAYGFLSLLLSFLNQDAQQKVDAGKMLGISAVFFSLKTLLESIAYQALAGNGAGVTRTIITTIASIGRFIGALLAIYAFFLLISAIKDHEAQNLQQSAIMLAVAAALLLLPVIFKDIGLPVIYISPASGSGGHGSITSTIDHLSRTIAID